MIYIGYAILFLGFIRLLVSVVNLWTNVYLPQNIHLENHPKVSILIPARNEEANIGKLLVDIENLFYTNYEVIVADYAFTDAYSVSWFLYEMGYLVELDKIKFI